MSTAGPMIAASNRLTFRGGVLLNGKFPQWRTALTAGQCGDTFTDLPHELAIRDRLLANFGGAPGKGFLMIC